MLAYDWLITTDRTLSLVESIGPWLQYTLYIVMIEGINKDEHNWALGQLVNTFDHIGAATIALYAYNIGWNIRYVLSRLFIAKNPNFLDKSRFS